MKNYYEIENFLDNPDIVRSYGCSLDYEPNKIEHNYIYSGYRSELKSDLIYNEIKNKLEEIFQDVVLKLFVLYHVNPKVSCEGSPHFDNYDKSVDKIFAGVIYLNPEPVEGSGTYIYDESDKDLMGMYFSNYLSSKTEVMYNVNIKYSNEIKQKAKQDVSEYKNKFKIIKYFEPTYNKLALYKANLFHSPGIYYGKEPINSRMTLVLHGSIA